MKYCLDISAIPYGTGVSLYTANLARALGELASNQDLVFFGSSFRHRSAFKPFTPAKIYSIPPKITSLLFGRINIPVSFFTGPIDVFHSWDWYTPKPKGFALVSTVHDLALFKFPNVAHPEILTHHRQSLLRLKQFGALVIAVSQSTKHDLIDLFDFDPLLITVIPEAQPLEHKLTVTPKKIQQFKAAYALTKPYFLLVGTREPRKNIDRQISSWRKFKADYDLVLVGKTGWTEIKPEPGLHLLGQSKPADLACLYHGAALLLYASLYEGFGLPILEAFYHQIPVVTSNLSSLPEVAGEAAVLVDPNEIEAIRAGIHTALDQSAVLVKQGLLRLKHYSWEATAAQTLAVYHQAAKLR